MPLFTSIPQGFVKMNLELTFNEDSVHTIENEVLRMMIRDYVVLYTKRMASDGRIVFNFYCKMGQQEMIAYNLGIYAQVFLRLHIKHQMSQHEVPEGFPECLMIQPAKQIK